MSIGRGFLGSVLGAAAGVLVWATLSTVTEWKLGAMSFVVGSLAGYGMAVGTQQRGSVGKGLMAACVAFLAIVAGKFYVATVVAEAMQREMIESYTLEDAHEALYVETYDDFVSRGVEMSESDEGYPTEVLIATERKWTRMSDYEKEEYRKQQVGSMYDTQEATVALTVLNFIFSFGPISLIIMGMSMFSAYKLGRATEKLAEQPQSGIVGGPLAGAAAMAQSQGPGAPMPGVPQSAVAASTQAKPKRPEPAEENSGSFFARIPGGASGPEPDPIEKVRARMQAKQSQRAQEQSEPQVPEPTLALEAQASHEDRRSESLNPPAELRREAA